MELIVITLTTSEGKRMKFTVQDRIVEAEAKRNAFFVDVAFSHGDEAALTSILFGPFFKGVTTDELALASFLGVMGVVSECKEPDSYNDPFAFRAWFDDSTDELDAETQEDLDLLELVKGFGLYEFWPHDVTYEERRAEYITHNLVYVDDEGYRRSVDVDG